ncbi:hypothetical protein BH10PSE7_BH10PSE7_27520 [soil metagenome]
MNGRGRWVLFAAIALFAGAHRAVACYDIQLFATSSNGSAKIVPLEMPACEAVRSNYDASDLTFVTRTVLGKTSKSMPQLGNTHSNPAESERSNTALDQVKAKVANLASYCADLHAAAKSSVNGAKSLGCSLSPLPRTPEGRALAETLMNIAADNDSCGASLVGAATWESLHDALTVDGFACSGDRCRRDIPVLMLEPGTDPTLVRATFAFQSIEVYRGASSSAGICLMPHKLIPGMTLLIDR